MRQSRTESLLLKPRKRGQTVRSADRFVKMSVSPQRNGQFAAEADLPGRCLNDPDEEIDPPEARRTHANQVAASLQTVNLCMHGLVLLNQLKVCPSPY